MASLFNSIFSQSIRRVRVSPLSLTVSSIRHVSYKPAFASPGISSCVFRASLPLKNRFLSQAVGALLVGAGISSIVGTGTSQVHCDSVDPLPSPPANDLPPPPASSVNLRELTFGTLCGLCAGVFIKKGLKTMAFVLGGIFVLLQYLGTLSFLKMDWTKVQQQFQQRFYTSDGKTPPSFFALWNWAINFLTADFQPRAAFVSGFALGLRIG